MAIKVISGVSLDIGADKFDFIRFDEDENLMSFKLQKGPIKESGVNGCQIDDILLTVSRIIQGFNEIKPCIENEQLIECLTKAEECLSKRRKDREARGVEGTSQD